MRYAPRRKGTTHSMFSRNAPGKAAANGTGVAMRRTCNRWIGFFTVLLLVGLVTPHAAAAATIVVKGRVSAPQVAVALEPTGSPELYGVVGAPIGPFRVRAFFANKPAVGAESARLEASVAPADAPVELATTSSGPWASGALSFSTKQLGDATFYVRPTAGGPLIADYTISVKIPNNAATPVTFTARVRNVGLRVAYEVAADPLDEWEALSYDPVSADLIAGLSPQDRDLPVVVSAFFVDADGIEYPLGDGSTVDLSSTGGSLLQQTGVALSQGTAVVSFDPGGAAGSSEYVVTAALTLAKLSSGDLDENLPVASTRPVRIVPGVADPTKSGPIVASGTSLKADGNPDNRITLTLHARDQFDNPLPEGKVVAWDMGGLAAIVEEEQAVAPDGSGIFLATLDSSGSSTVQVRTSYFPDQGNVTVSVDGVALTLPVSFTELSASVASPGQPVDTGSPVTGQTIDSGGDAAVDTVLLSFKGEIRDGKVYPASDFRVPPDDHQLPPPHPPQPADEGTGWVVACRNTSCAQAPVSFAYNTQNEGRSEFYATMTHPVLVGNREGITSETEAEFLGSSVPPNAGFTETYGPGLSVADATRIERLDPATGEIVDPTIKYYGGSEVKVFSRNATRLYIKPSPQLLFPDSLPGVSAAPLVRLAGVSLEQETGSYYIDLPGGSGSFEVYSTGTFSPAPSDPQFDRVDITFSPQPYLPPNPGVSSQTEWTKTVILVTDRLWGHTYNALSGFVAGDGAGIAGATGDILAGILIWGDVRDVVKNIALLWPGGGRPDWASFIFAAGGLAMELGPVVLEAPDGALAVCKVVIKRLGSDAKLSLHLVSVLKSSVKQIRSLSPADIRDAFKPVTDLKDFLLAIVSDTRGFKEAMGKYVLNPATDVPVFQRCTIPCTGELNAACSFFGPDDIGEIYHLIEGPLGTGLTDAAKSELGHRTARMLIEKGTRKWVVPGAREGLMRVLRTPGLGPGTAEAILERWGSGNAAEYLFSWINKGVAAGGNLDDVGVQVMLKNVGSPLKGMEKGAAFELKFWSDNLAPGTQKIAKVQPRTPPKNRLGVDFELADGSIVDVKNLSDATSSYSSQLAQLEYRFKLGGGVYESLRQTPNKIVYILRGSSPNGLEQAIRDRATALGMDGSSIRFAYANLPDVSGKIGYNVPDWDARNLHMSELFRP